jgi:hypothetical protein
MYLLQWLSMIVIDIRRLLGASFAILLMGFATASAASAPDEYAIGPAPAWAKPIAVDADAAAPVEQISDGAFFLLSDAQTRIAAGERVSYRHFATKAINAKGVESIANLVIAFDPAYQKLTLHSIDIVRDGHVLTKLHGVEVRILQRESALEFRIFDGSKTANMFLGDVRVGDVVEYAYSLGGHNPVFDGREFGTFFFQFGQPVEHIHARLLAPANRTLAIASRNTELKPTISDHDGYKDYEWDLVDAKSLDVEKDAPGWYSPQAAVQWSEFADWASVVHWAQPLYTVPSLGPALQMEVARIAHAEKDEPSRMLAALHFVQGEIRYLGVEVGAGSHAPNAPDLVFERRFGDCKDKALLTVAMLGALGIEARPALVNTSLRRGIEARHPGPDAFNHVVVRARIDGEYYWLDPTRSRQEGDLAHLSQPDYDDALVIDRSTTALTKMTPAVPRSSERSIKFLLDARSGIEEAVHYTVTTAFEGRRAEAMRDTLATTSREDFQNQNLNYFAQYYPQIKTTAPLEVEDDAVANRLVLTEHYDIAGFSSWSATRFLHEAPVHVPDILDVLREPTTMQRRAPLALDFPFDLTTVTTVLLPSDWKIESRKIVVDDAAFAFRRDVAYDRRRLVLTDHFKALADHVAPEDMVRYAGNLAQARQQIGYVLTLQGVGPHTDKGLLDRFNWPLGALGLMIFFVSTWMALAIYKRDRAPSAAPIDHSLEGLGGWLILPAIGVVLAPLRLAKNVYSAFGVVSSDTWAALTTYGSVQYNALWAPTLLFEMIANQTLLIFSLLLAVMFFQRRRGLPRLYIVLAFANVGVIFVDELLAAALHGVDPNGAKPNFEQTWQFLVGSAIWSWYFLVSKRVQSTFTRDHRAVAASPGTDATRVDDLALGFPVRAIEAEKGA